MSPREIFALVDLKNLEVCRSGAVKTGFLGQNRPQNGRFQANSADTTIYFPKPSTWICLYVSQVTFPHSFSVSPVLTCAVCAAYHVFGPIFPFFGLRQSDAYIDGSYSAGLYGYERYVDKVETNVRGLGKKVILGAQCKIQFSFLAFLGFFG